MSVWRLGFVAASVTWAAALWVVPWATVSFSGWGVSTAVFLAYTIGSLVCHQRPERSFHLWAVQLPVCARCVGIYLGGAIGACVALVRGHPQASGNPRFVLLAAAVPTAVTLVYEWIFGVTPDNWIRALTGLPLGIAIGALVVEYCGETPLRRPVLDTRERNGASVSASGGGAPRESNEGNQVN